MALFAGAGGGILGGKRLGWKTVCAVEWDTYAACVLAARQNDKILAPFPIWDDVQTFDGKPWRGLVDVVSGGFPCQDISSAGKGAGIEGSRSSMWKHMARIIGEVRPRYAFVENSPLLISRGAAMVIGDLTEMGYDCQWCIVSAQDVGAPHQRDRFWLVAHAKGERCWQGGEQSYILGEDGRQNRPLRSIARCAGEQSKNVADAAGAQDHAKRGDCQCGRNAMGRTQQAAQQNHGAPNHNSPYGCRSHVANTHSTQCEGSGISSGIPPQNSNIGGYGSNAEVSNTNSAQRKRNERAERSPASRAVLGKHNWWASEPNVGRVADGVAARVDRLKAIGNGQVPIVAETAWKILSQ